MNTYRDNSADWIFFADSDVKAAAAMLREEIFHMACFHAQQAVEKSLKGYLRFKQAVVPKTHSLPKLLSEVKKRGLNTLNEDDIFYVEQFYSPTRYPDTLPGSLPEGLPTRDDAEKALRIAEEVFVYTTKLISSNSR